MVRGVAAVSSLGRFRSTRGVVSTPKARTNGYVEVGIHGKKYLLHRLVAVAFGIRKTDDKTQVNHKNGNPSDNRLSNLEWVTQSENITHSYRTNKARASCAIRKSKPVRARKLGTDEWMDFASGRVASRVLGIDRSNIRACIMGRLQTCNGYEFKQGMPRESPLLPGEEWRDSHDGACVSSMGRLRNRDGVVFTPKPRQDGYVQTMIASKNYLVHRLVATSFLPLPPSPDHVEVNHKDGDPSNNCVSNLEWCTKQENVKHSYDTNTERATSVGRLAKPVRGRRQDDASWTVYPGGAHDAARALGLNHGNVSAVCLGLRASTCGYVFEYDEPLEEDVLEGEAWADVVFDD